MHLFLREGAEDLDDVLIGDFFGFFEGHALDQFGEGGAGGDGADAAEGFEFRLGDPTVFIEFEGEAERVAAAGVADLADAVGVFDFADVLRVQEIFHYFRAVIPHITFPLLRARTGGPGPSASADRRRRRSRRAPFWRRDRPLGRV